jgi:hypothetical protein
MFAFRWNTLPGPTSSSARRAARSSDRRPRAGPRRPPPRPGDSSAGGAELRRAPARRRRFAVSRRWPRSPRDPSRSRYHQVAARLARGTAVTSTGTRPRSRGKTSSGMVSTNSRAKRSNSPAASIGCATRPPVIIGPIGRSRYSSAAATPKLPPLTAKTPEQIGMLVAADGQHTSVRRHELDGEHVAELRISQPSPRRGSDP